MKTLSTIDSKQIKTEKKRTVKDEQISYSTAVIYQHDNYFITQKNPDLLQSDMLQHRHFAAHIQ